MRWSYKRVWWYRQLILSLANTGEVLYLVNRRTTCRDIDMRRLVVLSLALGIALIPCSLVGQEEEQEEGRDWTGGLVTGVVVGTAASSLAAAGLCAWPGTAGTCAGDGALYGFLPALASGYGLSYPDRTTWKGRLRTVALGSAGGLLTVLALRLAADLDPPVYALSSGRGRLFLGPALWGAGVGLATAFFGPSVQAYLFPSPAAPEARNTSPLGLGLAFRFPLP